MKYVLILFAAIFLSLYAQSANAAISRIQEISATGTSSAASIFATATFASPTGAGHLLVALVTSYPQISFTASTAGFVSAVSNINADGSGNYLFYSPSAASLSTVTFKITQVAGTTRSWTIFIAEYAGIISNSPLDAYGSNQSASGAIPTGGVTPTFIPELIIAGCTNLGSSTFSSPTGGFSIIDQQTIGSGSYLQSAVYMDQIVNTINSYSGTVTASAGSGGNGVIASFPANPDNAIFNSMGF
jgi:hypothetical protein